MTESAVAPPDDHACWEPPPGSWALAAPLTQLWLAGAISRTVSTLPRLHPWRLGDAKGTARLIQWTALADAPPTPSTTSPGGATGNSADAAVLPAGGQTFAALTVTARDPDLQAGEPDRPGGDPDALLYGWGPGIDSDSLLTNASGALLGAMVHGLSSNATDALRGAAPRWAGAITRIPGTWVPPLAVLSRATRGVADPGTSWQTESWDFDARVSVYADDHEYAANVLAPHVMAIILDQVPHGAAVTLAGDTLHVWWPYREDLADEAGRVAQTVSATQHLAEAIPDFVFADHPDHSDHVQEELDSQTAAARAYQQQRRPGHSPDPTLQHIYDAARAAAGLPPAQ